jgi:hypothetical protein
MKRLRRAFIRFVYMYGVFMWMHSSLMHVCISIRGLAHHSNTLTIHGVQIGNQDMCIHLNAYSIHIDAYVCMHT